MSLLFAKGIPSHLIKKQQGQKTKFVWISIPLLDKQGGGKLWDMKVSPLKPKLDVYAIIVGRLQQMWNLQWSICDGALRSAHILSKRELKFEHWLMVAHTYYYCLVREISQLLLSLPCCLASQHKLTSCLVFTTTWGAHSKIMWQRNWNKLMGESVFLHCLYACAVNL